MSFKGLSQHLTKAVMKLGRLCYERKRVLFWQVTTVVGLPIEPLRIEAANWSEYQRWAQQDSRLKYELEIAERRYRKGDIAYVANVEGKLVHVIWGGTRQELQASYELGETHTFPLAQEVGFLIDSWTPPHARGKGYYPAVLRTVIDLHVTNYGEVWFGCLDDNTSSLKGLGKCGFSPANANVALSRIRVFRLFEFRRVEWLCEPKVKL